METKKKKKKYLRLLYIYILLTESGYILFKYSKKKTKKTTKQKCHLHQLQFHRHIPLTTCLELGMILRI